MVNAQVHINTKNSGRVKKCFCDSLKHRKLPSLNSCLVTEKLMKSRPAKDNTSVSLLVQNPVQDHSESHDVTASTSFRPELINTDKITPTAKNNRQS